MSTQNKIILLFTKYPRPGFSKTRLIPELGPHGAAELQKQMTNSVVQTIANLLKTTHYSLEIHYTGGSLEQMRSWLGEEYCYKMQAETSLGERLEQAIQPHLQANNSIVVIGADCPDIRGETLTTALTSLSTHQLAIGPTFDGGYYLLGVNGNLPQSSLHHLLQNIPWGSTNVYSQTMKRVQKLNLQHHTLPKLHDIDTPEDLRYINYYSDPQ